MVSKWLNPLKHMPDVAAYDAYKNDGDVMGAVMDPAEHIQDWRAETPEESAAIVAKGKKKRRERRGYKKGGETHMACRGGGAATRGKRFSKNG